jgi:hypothetical protein
MGLVSLARPPPTRGGAAGPLRAAGSVGVGVAVCSITSV